MRFNKTGSKPLLSNCVIGGGEPGWVVIARTVMFRMNGTSRLSTWMCDAKRLGDQKCVWRVLAITTHPDSSPTTQWDRSGSNPNYSPRIRSASLVKLRHNFDKHTVVATGLVAVGIDVVFNGVATDDFITQHQGGATGQA